MLGLASSPLDPLPKVPLQGWRLRKKDLKKYPHFDPIIPASTAETYVRDPTVVSRHNFFPFIQYVKRWKCFRKEGEPTRWKKRKIRYAARLDSYIFSYYRHLLLPKYESELVRLGITSGVLAYRQIPIPGRPGNKCNIHFAYDAFDKIEQLGNCSAIALDISSYFESLDHKRLKKLWCELLGVCKLPEDHLHVFDAITRYSWVEKEMVYGRLGHFGKKLTSRGDLVDGYLTPYRKIPKCLCNGRTFRHKVAGNGEHKSIIRKNKVPFGIPQGAPLSDLLANIYLVEFDKIVSDWADALGGVYFRYSDDILLVIPGGEQAGKQLMIKVRQLIARFGEQLKIKESKSLLVAFERHNGCLQYRCSGAAQRKNGLEYLGFRFDGKRVYLRDSSLSNLLRKTAWAAKREAEACATKYPEKSVAGLQRCFNYERLLKKFCRVEDFGEMSKDYRKWTFWTYARRASREFGLRGRPISRQLNKYRRFVIERANMEIENAVARRNN